MSILSELNTVIDTLEIPVESGLFSNTPPTCYVVLTPINDTFDAYGDNKPSMEVSEVRVSLFNYGNFMEIKDKIVKALMDADFTITDRQYAGFDTETGYHNYAIDVAKQYEIKEEN